jgi:hypothetical protein
MTQSTSLREPTRSQEVNAKKRRRLPPLGMTVFSWRRLIPVGITGLRDDVWLVLTPGGASPAPTTAGRKSQQAKSAGLERDGGAGAAGGAVDGFD